MRLKNWESNFNRLVELKRKQPGAWGVNDCCLFVADFVKEITGYDPAADLRGKYTTALEAMRIVESMGGVEEILNKRLAPVLVCRKAGVIYRGDVVVYDGENGLSAGVYAGKYSIFAGEDCMTFVESTRIKKTWGVG